MAKLGLPELIMLFVIAPFVYVAYRLWMAGKGKKMTTLISYKSPGSAHSSGASSEPSYSTTLANGACYTDISF